MTRRDGTRGMGGEGRVKCLVLVIPFFMGILAGYIDR